MNQNGAHVERGIVKEVADGGYRVDSYTRDGIVTPALPALPGAAFEVGNRVYYVMFDDGCGLILSAF